VKVGDDKERGVTEELEDEDDVLEEEELNNVTIFCADSISCASTASTRAWNLSLHLAHNPAWEARFLLPVV
jgi:hypothetical protein